MATRPTRDITTDVLIVGSGPIGCTYARCLVQAGRQVLMVEAGAQHSKRPGEHLKNAFVYQRDIDRFSPIVLGLLHPISVPTGAAKGGALDPVAYRVLAGIRGAQNPEQDPLKNLPAAAVAYGVGGMFTHWTSNTPRYHPTLERVGWISPMEWDQLYAVAERLCNTHTDVFERSIRHTLVTERLQEHLADRCRPPYHVQPLPVAGERRKDNDEFVHYSGSDTILGPLIDQPDRFAPDAFAILTEHRATELVRKGERIDHVVVEDLIHWGTVRVRADIIVVAAGSILTPQILWNSGIRPRPLGRYLTEHPMTFCQVVMDADLVERSRKLSESAATSVATTPSDDPVPIPMNDPPPMVWIPVSEERRWHCQAHRDSFQYGQLPPDVDDRVVVDLRWFGMVDPVEENLVTFSGSAKDKFGMPKPQFEFSLGADDGRRAHEMMSDMVDCAQALGGFLPGSEPRFMPLGSSLHFLGTTRMGAREDGASVIDPWCRFWGLENLYLGGNGVTPTSTASNPTLTSIAMAVRSAGSITGLPPSDLAPE